MPRATAAWNSFPYAHVITYQASCCIVKGAAVLLGRQAWLRGERFTH